MTRLRTSIGLIVIVILLVILSPAGINAARAGTATGFLTFETGNDAEAVTISGISFTTASGAPWLYADTRTHQYNSPYPANCSDRPVKIRGPVCAYSMSGDIYVWTGFVNNSGRFDFTQGTASFVDFDLSTGENTTVLAFNSTGKAIAAAYIKPNLYGSDSRAVHLEAPASEAISYVTICGVANFWVLDDLATDAPSVPDQRPRVNAYPAQLSLALRASPNVAVAPDDMLTLTIRVANHGRGTAKDATIRLPLSGLPVTVLDASFSRAGAWVNALDADALTIRTGGLGPDGDSLTATLKLRVQRNAAIGTSFATQLALRWSDAVSGGEIRSNLLSLNVADTSANTAYYALTVEKDSYSSAIFAPGEPVGAWYNTPDGKAVTLDTIRANAKGEIAFTLDTSGLPAGTYSVVTYGHWTELTAVAPFTQP